MENIPERLQKFINLSFKILISKILVIITNLYKTFIIFVLLTLMLLVFHNVKILAQDNSQENNLENVEIEEKSTQKIKAEINPEIEDVFLENISLSLIDLKYNRNYGFDIFYFNYPINKVYLDSSYSFTKFYNINFLYSQSNNDLFFNIFANINNYNFVMPDILDKIYFSTELFFDYKNPLYFKIILRNYNFLYQYSDSTNTKSYSFKFFAFDIDSYYNTSNFFINFNNSLNYNYNNIYNFFNLETFYDFDQIKFSGFIKWYNIDDFILGIGIKGKLDFNPSLSSSFYFYPVFYNNFDMIGKLNFNFNQDKIKLDAYFEKKLDFNKDYFDMFPVFNYNGLKDCNVVENLYSLFFSFKYFNFKNNENKTNNPFINIEFLYSYIESQLFIVSDNTSMETIFQNINNLNNINIKFSINSTLFNNLNIIFSQVLNLYFANGYISKQFYNEPLKFLLSFVYDFSKFSTLIYVSYKTSLFRYDNIGALDPLHIVDIKFDFYGINKIFKNENNNIISFEISLPFLPTFYTRYFVISNPEFTINVKLFF